MNVLLAVDDAEGATVALERFEKQFRSDRTVVRVLHVDEWAKGLPMSLAFAEGPSAGDDLIAYRSARRQEAESIVSRVAGSLADQGFQVTTCVAEGEARHQILEVAEQWPADLIVLGSHGRTGLTRVLLGSVSVSVSRQASCSVLIGHQRESSRPVVGPSTSSATPRRSRLKTVLAVDGSDWSVYAVEMLLEFFVRDSLEVRVVHVDEWPLNPPSPELTRLYTASRLAAHDLVAGVVKRLTEAGVQASGVERNGDARYVILDLAREWWADLILLGSQGKTGLERAFLGSVSDAVSRHATCAVLIARRRPQPTP